MRHAPPYRFWQFSNSGHEALAAKAFPDARRAADVHRASVAVALALGLALPMLATPAAAQATSEYDERDITLEPGLPHHPLPVSLAAGDAIAYDWRVKEPAGAVVYFSTHMHLGAQLINITEGNVTAKSGKLVADRAGQYSMLWQNNGGAAVTLHISYHTERSAQKTPWPAALVLVALASTALALRRR
jgi:hypothetical protein